MSRSRRVLHGCAAVAVLALLAACGDQTATSPETSPQGAVQADAERGALAEPADAVGNEPMSATDPETGTPSQSTGSDPGGQRIAGAVVDTASQEIHLQTMDFGDECTPMSFTCDNPVDDPVDGRTYMGGFDDYSGPFYCPPRVGIVEPGDFTVITWRQHDFWIWGWFYKISDLASNTGIPRAKYRLPPGPWESNDGAAMIWSGTMEGSCFIRQGSSGPIGFVVWSRFQGDAIEFDASGSTSWSSWESDVEAVPEIEGDYDEEVEDVLTRFIGSGECTEGWIIYVDDERVC